MHKDTTFFLIPTNKKGNKTENEDFFVMLVGVRFLVESVIIATFASVFYPLW